MLAFISNARAGTVIDVLFVFNSQASASISNKQVWVDEQISRVNTFLVASGRPTLRFHATVDTQALSYSTSGKSTHTVINWMQSSSALAGRRGSNDLVVLVGTNMSNACGAASALRDSISSLNRDLAQYAVIDASAGCPNPPGRVLGHELGHLLYLEHQVHYDSIGQLLIDGDDYPTKPSNSYSVYSPVAKNHAYIEDDDVSNSPRSLMASPLHATATFDEFTDGGGDYDPDFEDQTAVMGVGIPLNGSWDAVSRYRDPPPSVACGAYFLGCPVGCGHSPYILTWSSPTATSYQVQHKLFGSWNSYYSGSGLSTLASTGTVFSEQFRVRGINSGGSGNWCTIWIQVQCSDTQDPW